ncbi:hypothetical protein NLJ89_g3186 [Agrocybe chaxingu]|uniref:Uncharacterized protein n=1 Tax=Agrocybe chaxingu TaxID=84603 RepID=A0A9W8K5C6_9AGAR|nr:hypothetical protein NLJ89_g3186 [Agrocybe chaxingu]
MAKKTFAPKPALEKLPLAVRKDLRDNFESKKEEFESQINEILGVAVKINIEPNAVWAYAEASGASSAGSTIAGYIEGFVDAAKSYVSKFGDLGKEYFKNAVSKAELTLVVNEKGADADSIHADVKDGVFRILFHQERLGYNQSWLSDPFVKAIDTAPQEGFDLLAKHSIETEYNAEIETVQEEIGKTLNLPDVVLDPNFEENYSKLLKKADKDWQRTFGRATFEYFNDGLKSQLERQGFKGDEMLQEGFAEGVPSKTFKLRIVDKTKSGSTNETILEDGVVFIQTTIDNWWYNVYEAGSKVVDLL